MPFKDTSSLRMSKSEHMGKDTRQHGPRHCQFAPRSPYSPLLPWCMGPSPLSRLLKLQSPNLYLPLYSWMPSPFSTFHTECHFQMQTWSYHPNSWITSSLLNLPGRLMHTYHLTFCSLDIVSFIYLKYSATHCPHRNLSSTHQLTGFRTNCLPPERCSLILPF